MASILRVCAIFLIAGPLSAMFAEPFFQALFDHLGINTAEWAVPAVTALIGLFSTVEFRYVSFLLIGIGVGVWVHWLAARFDRRSGHEESRPLQIVANKSFRDETILIDGKAFIKCDFEEVFIQWDGGPYGFTDCKISPARVKGFATNDKAVMERLRLLGILGVLHPRLAAGMNFPIDPFDAELLGRPHPDKTPGEEVSGAPSWAKSEPESALTLRFGEDKKPKNTYIRNIKEWSHFTNDDGAFNLRIKYEIPISNMNISASADKDNVKCELVENGTDGASYKITGNLDGLVLEVRSGFKS